MQQTNAATEQLDDPEMGSTWFYSIVGIIIFIVFCLAVSVLFFSVEDGFTDTRVVAEGRALSDAVRREQQVLLGQYGVYEEPGDGDDTVERIRIPIERAIELKAAQSK